MKPILTLLLACVFVACQKQPYDIELYEYEGMEKVNRVRKLDGEVVAIWTKERGWEPAVSLSDKLDQLDRRIKEMEKRLEEMK